MDTHTSPEEQLRAEIATLRLKLEKAEDTLRAIRTGDVDSIVVETENRPQLFTLRGLAAVSNDFRGELRAALGDRREWRGESVHRTKDGGAIAVETSVTALRDASGTPAGHVGVHRDITVCCASTR